MKYATLKFHSCAELADHVDTLLSNKVARPYGTYSTDEGSEFEPSFFGDWSMRDAVKCGLSGGTWHEGAEAMPRLHIPHETLTGAAIESPMMDVDIAGFAPNVPAFLSGAPDSMFHMPDQYAGDKLLRVAVHVGRYAGADQPAILNRGAAIMAVLDQLSREGYSIELWAIWRNDAHGENGISIETCIKHGQDFWSPESVAFALCHASFQRRLCWRVAESIDSAEHMTGNPRHVRLTAGGYGRGDSADFSDFDLSYGYLTPEVDPQVSTPEKAVNHIKKQTIKQLKRGQYG